jgi:hypothetical protein
VSDRADASPFDLRTVVLMIAAGLLAAAGFVLLIAYGPQFRAGHDGGAHPLSIGGTGFRGIVKLLDETGIETAMVRDDEGLVRASLLIVTPTPDSDRTTLKHIAEVRRYMPTLYILPKWTVIPLPGKQGWIRRIGAPDTDEAQGLLSALAPSLRVAGGELPGRARPVSAVSRGVIIKAEQWLTGTPLTPLISDNGRTILGRAGTGRMYILADPDLMANHALKRERAARTAIEIIAALRPDRGPVAFDLTLHGFGRSRSLLKTLLSPPFLALTLALLAAALLAGLHAIGRFGPPRREPRALAPGKAALIDNAARLIRRARRSGRMGAGYVAMTRDAAAGAIHAPHLGEPELEAWLDRSGPHDKPAFSQLAEAARRADTPATVTEAARALYHWRRSLGA